jgi:hypothetical protein
MPRDRYPSDDRRLRQRPHVKVHLSWPTHPRYGRAYADRDIRAIVLGVWMLAARAHASATGDRVTLGPDQIAETCACRRPDVALTWLRRACHVMGWSLEYDGHVAVIEVRNFARKQGFDSARRGVTPRNSAPSEEPKNRRTEEPIPRSASPRSRTARPKASLPPWALECSRLLIELLEPVPGARIARGAETAWAKQIARMPDEIPELRGNGKAPEEHIAAAIRWALGPENLGREYEVVIRSAKSLREKWPQLVAAARRRRGETAPKEAMDEWVRTGRVTRTASGGA